MNFPRKRRKVEREKGELLLLYQKEMAEKAPAVAIVCIRVKLFSISFFFSFLV
jgi:hypothetical protein